MNSPILSERRPEILVVENHPDTLKYLVMFLQDLGYHTQQARTMERGIATWEMTACQVLISDIGLPDGDGWQLIQRLHERGRSPRLAIAMSGFGMNADENKSHAAGYQYHLIKPFDPDRLEKILGETGKQHEEVEP